MADIWGTQAATVMVMSQCIDENLKCHRVCVDTAAQCLIIGGEYAERVRLLWDCAQVCQLNADFMLRKSEFYIQSCELSAQVCLRCAEACAESEDDHLMALCAQACRRCAACCQEIAVSMA